MAEWEHGVEHDYGGCGPEQGSKYKASREYCMLLTDGMNRFINARVGCQNDVIWHLTICDVWRKKYDVITKDSAICFGH